MNCSYLCDLISGTWRKVEYGDREEELSRINPGFQLAYLGRDTIKTENAPKRTTFKEIRSEVFFRYIGSRLPLKQPRKVK